MQQKCRIGWNYASKALSILCFPHSKAYFGLKTQTCGKNKQVTVVEFIQLRLTWEVTWCWSKCERCWNLEKMSSAVGKASGLLLFLFWLSSPPEERQQKTKIYEYTAHIRERETMCHQRAVSLNRISGRWNAEIVPSSSIHQSTTEVTVKWFFKWNAAGCVTYSRRVSVLCRAWNSNSCGLSRLMSGPRQHLVCCEGNNGMLNYTSIKK